jgi:adenylylsulfate kinase
VSSTVTFVMRISPHVIWLFGLSGAGKSTLSRSLSEELRKRQVSVLTLDGDELRSGLCSDLGFTDRDRSENLRRAANVAKLGLQSGLCVIASFITPLEKQRHLIAEVIGTSDVSLIYLNASIETCRARDVKGLYARASSGALLHMTGVSSLFEVPLDADLTVETNCVSIQVATETLLQFTIRRLFATGSSNAIDRPLA